jgi:hypothetical protein
MGSDCVQLKGDGIIVVVWIVEVVVIVYSFYSEAISCVCRFSWVFLVQVDSGKLFEKENSFYQIFFFLGSNSTFFCYELITWFFLYIYFLFFWVLLGIIHLTCYFYLAFFCCRGVSCRAYLSTPDLFCLIIIHFHDCCPEQRYRQWETNNCIHTTFLWV